MTSALAVLTDDRRKRTGSNFASVIMRMKQNENPLIHHFYVYFTHGRKLFFFTLYR